MMSFQDRYDETGTFSRGAIPASGPRSGIIRRLRRTERVQPPASLIRASWYAFSVMMAGEFSQTRLPIGTWARAR
jgi:hypothetical protein